MQASDPNWIPPLLIDQKSRFSRKYPFYEHGDVESFLAYVDGQPVGRVSAIVNRAHNDFYHDRVGFFGLFESVNDQSVAMALLSAAEKFLRARGMDVIRGPMNFSTNDEIGMLIEGFTTPPAIMMLHNPPYFNDLLADCGFRKAVDVLAYEMCKGQMSDRVFELGRKIEQRLKLRVRPFNTRDFWREVDRVLEVYNQAWDANWGYVPMTPAEIKLMAQTLKLIYDPRLIHFVEDAAGRPVGFVLALPDIHVLYKRLNGHLFPTGLITLLAKRRKLQRMRVLAMGVVKDYRGRGIDTVLYCRLYESAAAAGYNWGEFSWILEDNRMMNDAAKAMGAVPYKKWRIWEKPISE